MNLSKPFHQVFSSPKDLFALGKKEKYKTNRYPLYQYYCNFIYTSESLP